MVGFAALNPSDELTQASERPPSTRDEGRSNRHTDVVLAYSAAAAGFRMRNDVPVGMDPVDARGGDCIRRAALY
jgi:hypothetical protein